MDLTAANVRTVIDANKSIFSPSPTAQPDVQSDGYVATAHAYNLFSGNFGTTANPVAAAKVSKPFTTMDLVTACPTTMATASDTVLATIAPLVVANNRSELTAWAQILAARNVMSSTELTAFNALMAETIDDPKWPPHTSLAQANFGVDYVPVALINQALGRA